MEAEGGRWRAGRTGLKVPEAIVNDPLYHFNDFRHILWGEKREEEGRGKGGQDLTDTNNYIGGLDPQRFHVLKIVFFKAVTREKRTREKRGERNEQTRVTIWSDCRTTSSQIQHQCQRPEGK